MDGCSDLIACIRLIIGLGNPEEDYCNTRHNVGKWFLDLVAKDNGAKFLFDKKFGVQVCFLNFRNSDRMEIRRLVNGCWLLKPNCFMNCSGLSVQKVADYFRMPNKSIMIAHDELDLSCGVCKLKFGGGHNGHNGLKDIVEKLKGRGGDFYRLRIGIGRPIAAEGAPEGHADHKREIVSNYVLSRPAKKEKDLIMAALSLSSKRLLNLFDENLTVQCALNIMNEG